jgi:Tfp pilus assembly protein PilV
MGIQKRSPEARTADREAGLGLVEAVVAGVIILIAAAGIFRVLDYAARQNTSAAQSWAQVESAMTDWSQTTVPVSVTQSVAVTVSGLTTGQQVENVSVAETASGNAPYGWWRSSP